MDSSRATHYIAGDVLKPLTTNLAAIVAIAITFFSKSKRQKAHEVHSSKKESNFDIKSMRSIEESAKI